MTITKQHVEEIISRIEIYGHGAKLQRLGKFIEYNDEDDGDDY
uniref:Uncharacterized protein n=1 Tax=Salmonella phage vB_STmST19_KE13 TaxID=3161167 RepID=A0AAU8GCV5_9CAUD